MKPEKMQMMKADINQISHDKYSQFKICSDLAHQEAHCVTLLKSIEDICSNTLLYRGTIGIVILAKLSTKLFLLTDYESCCS